MQARHGDARSFQSVSRAESDYVRTFGVDAWKRTLADNLSAPALEDRPADDSDHVPANGESHVALTPTK